MAASNGVSRTGVPGASRRRKRDIGSENISHFGLYSARIISSRSRRTTDTSTQGKSEESDMVSPLEESEYQPAASLARYSHCIPERKIVNDKFLDRIAC